MAEIIETKNIDTIISEWANVIAIDIAERRFYDKGEVAAYAKTKLFTAISECINIQVDNLIRERTDLTIEFNLPTTAVHRKMKIQAKLTELNLKIKERRYYQEKTKDTGECKALKKYINNRFGKDVMDDFYYKINNDIDF